MGTACLVAALGLWLSHRVNSGASPAKKMAANANTAKEGSLDHAPLRASPPSQAAVLPKANQPAVRNTTRTWPTVEAATESQFAQFHDWLRRYHEADVTEKSALEAEGKILAQARLTALADLIQTNPKRALELALSASARETLPDTIRALLEKPINASGDFAVMATFPVGETNVLPAVFRTASVAGEQYHAFTYGKGLQFVTKKNVPLNGYAVPASAATRPPQNPLVRASQLAAFDPNPARVLDAAEVDAIKTARGADVVCSVSGQSWTENHEETAAEIAGNILTFCGPAHLKLIQEQAIAASGLTTPGGEKDLSPAKSSYTEGRKRMLLMRPYWTNQAIALNTNSAITHFINFSNYMWQMSYGKLVFAALGKGSDISTELLIPGDVNSYVAGLGSGAGEAWQAVRDVARTNYNYDLTKYDFLYYITTDKPAASYCGLGFVGGVGFHLANSCFGPEVAGHEYGHNLGLNHAHFWDTSLQSMVGTGQNVEYGDNNDPMGGGGNPNQYNSRYKNYLGWITNTDIVTIPASGYNRYRLYCFDLDYSVGIRGLKFTHSGSDNYWINFRQRKTSSPALMNGVQLLWTGNGNEGSYLLDVRLKGNADNNAVVIGRTFSDTNLNFHFTPIGKGNTYPESIDVVAVTGAQPGNLPPVATVSASTLTPSVGQSVTFTASATDPNGDVLAYYWEFGDGADSYSSNNQPTQNHAFSSAGEYAVRCVVSDMRGGTAQHTLIVRVGSPSVFRISGHVADSRSQPFAGALITAGSKSVYSDADGSYTIAGLAAGSYNVSAIEPVHGALQFVHPFFNNPVVLGPSAQHIDFVAGTNAPLTTLLATGAVWKYLDNGSDQGTAWIAPAFNDAAWSSGPSQLGYGDGDESTTIGYGGNANNKYITYYFRNSFNVANPATLTNIALNVLRDDGVIVYLNGTEIFRDNMPGGAVSYTTLASASASDDGKTWLLANVSPSLFVAGANVIAAEVHQDAVNSSDITFDLFLTAESTANIARGAIVYVDSPVDNATFTSPTNITISASAYSTPASVTNVDIYDGATKLAAFASAPYSTVLNNPANGLHILRAMSTDSTGLRRTSAPVNITVTAPVAPPVALTFVQTGAVWRYYCTNIGASFGWQNSGFNDANWNVGAARIGFNSGNTGVATPIYGGSSSARYPAAYFRTAFVANDPAAVTNLIVQFARDDGIIIYLNGVELRRDNITNGVPPSYSMLASNATDNGSTYFTLNVPPGALVPGSNVLAAEVHQSSATSSDLIFDLGLSALASTNRTRGCWLASPADGSVISLPGSVALTAQVVAGGNLSVTNVEFYSDGVKIGEDATSPFSFAWSNPPGGAHSLTAVAHDSTGASITSASVAITVSGAPIGDALISFGDVWKYLDDGSNLGTTWTAGAFNDNQWMMGAGKLGYGGDGEITTISYGTNANFKYITTYFRKKFVVSNPASFSGLLLRLIRDDGAVIYLNGTEVLRTNMPAGPLVYNSLALTAIGGADETTPLDVLLTAANLVPGTNTIAVEMHQDSVTSSDLGFDLALIGLHNTNTTDGVYITGPASGAHYNMPANISLAAYAASSAGPVTLVEYFDGVAKVGQATASPYSTAWNGAAAGNHSLIAVATVAANRMTSAPVSIVVGPAPAPISPVFTQFIDWGSQWKYWDSASAAANGWQALAFDDGAWLVGNARFGWGIDGEATLLTPRTTHYFRKTFVVNNGGALDSLTFNVLRDDGAIVYLNGVEVFRTNMPAGPVNNATLASATVNTPDETIPVVYTMPASISGLLHGTNVVAVELHQSSATSSDGGFDLSLYGEGTTEPRIYLVAPANGSTHVTGSAINFEAQAQVAAGRTLAAVEFFSDGTNFGQALASPYRVSWSGSPTGAHSIVARVVDTLGASVTSAPVQINVGYPTVSLVLIASNSIWKYLDDGSNQGTNWSQVVFNDATWSSGVAELGYGDLPEGRPETTVICCSNAAVKNITYYFRRAFTVPPDTFMTNLTFRLVRDDGAVVYLDGRELYRSNMPGGTVTSATVASSAVSGTDEATFFATTLATTNCSAGAHVLAVEVHQNANNSSDVSFNLQLEGDGYIFSSAAPALTAVEMGGQFRIAWPASASGYQLYSSPEVGPTASWQLVSGPLTITNGFKVLTIPATNPAAFYRLQKP